jgi:CBS domain-containing protein
MNAADVMTTDVITVGPSTKVGEVAEIMATRRVSALPVVGEHGGLLGIVSEGDLIQRAEVGTGHRHSWWLRMLMGQEALAIEYVKENAVKVADVMTRDVVTARPDTPLGAIATLLERHRIKRVPIVADGKVVGIVSRANLIQALASLRKKLEAAASGDDSKLRDRIMTRLNAEPWTHPVLLNVTVHDGAVDLWGIVNSTTERTAVRVAVEAAPGVRQVSDNLIVRSGIEN